MKRILMGAALGLVSLVGGAARADGFFFGTPHVQVRVNAPPAPVYRPYGVVYQQPLYPRPMFGHRRWNDPGMFAAQVRGEVNGIAFQLHNQVRSGEVAPYALRALQDGRMEIETTLAQVSAKGFLTRFDRDLVEQRVQQLRNLDDRYRVSRGGVPCPQDRFGYDG